MSIRSNIFILSGPVQSGKTTSLIQWIQGQREVFGILTPIIEGKRCFMDVNTKEIFLMEATEDDREIIETGRYKFSKSAFDRADKILSIACKQPEGWLILDEIGPLELKDKGFFTRLKTLLENETNNLNIIIVIRESLKEKVISKFGLRTYTNFTT